MFCTWTVKQNRLLQEDFNMEVGTRLVEICYTKNCWYPNLEERLKWYLWYWNTLCDRLAVELPRLLNLTFWICRTWNLYVIYYFKLTNASNFLQRPRPLSIRQAGYGATSLVTVIITCISNLVIFIECSDTRWRPRCIYHRSWVITSHLYRKQCHELV